MSASMPMVTTQGCKFYTRATICQPHHAKVAHKRSALPAHPIPSKTSKMLKTTKLSGSHSSIPVCSVQYDSIPASQISNYELLRLTNGDFKYIQRTADCKYFDINYYNAELRKPIPLGRFTDSATASLAHAIARSDETCRVVPYAAQGMIEHFSHLPAPPALVQDSVNWISDVMTDAAGTDQMEVSDDMNYDSLFKF